MAKKCLSVLLAVMMMFSIVPATSIQAAAADNIDDAEALSLNSFNNAVITNEGESAYYSFVPEKEGTYVVYSTSNADTSVNLYNSSGNLLASDDDSGDNFNFRLQYDMKSNETYYFEVKYSGDTTGTIPFAFGKTYTVTYKAGEGVADMPGKQTKDFGKEIVLSAVEPTRVGYKFLGWSTSSSSSTIDYISESVYSDERNAILYAVWALDINSSVFSGESVTLNVAAEAEILSPEGKDYFKFTAPANGIYAFQSKTNKNVALKLYDDEGVPVDGGYFSGDPNFGFLFEVDAGQVLYLEVSYSENDRIGVFPFVIYETYSVSYVVNGGTISPASQLKIHDTPLYVESPTRVGYMFKGWATQPDSEDVVYSAGDYYATNADVALYAVWEKATELTLNSKNEVEIIEAGDSKYYSYTPTVDGMYVIYSTSAVDTQVTLYDESGIEIYYNDKMSDTDDLHYFGEYEEIRDKRFENDFRLPYYMYAGKTYYFEVSFNKEIEKTRVGTIPFTFGEAYTVSFDTTGGTTAPSPQIKDFGATLVLNGTVPTRVGYAFKGWATSENGPVVYLAGDDYSANESATLYAVWEQGLGLAVNSINVAVIDNPGESKYFTFTAPKDGSYVIYSTADSDTCVTVYDSKGNKIGENDDTFKDFNLKLRCELTRREKYYFEIKYYDETETGTIPFTFGEVYDVVYKINGGVFATQKKEYGINLTLDCAEPTKEGYTFKGWSTSATDSTVAYVTGNTYTNEANVTLYAVWELNKYDVVYNANGGENAPVGQVKTHFEALTLSTEIPTREGYTFKGWSTSANGEVEYAPGATYTAEAGVTLYAVWEINAEYVTVNSTNNAVINNAGESKYFTFTPDVTDEYVVYSTGDADTQVNLYDAEGNLLSSDDDEGALNNFRMQYNMTAGEKYYIEVKYSNATVTGTISFVFGEVYTVTYKANGGDKAPKEQTKDFAYAITLSETIPTKVGYTFLGWATNPNATTVTYEAGAIFKDNADTILYAVWELNTYDVVYNANGGENAPAGQVKTHFEDLTLTTEIPTKEGHTFKGWATSANGEVKYAPGDVYSNEEPIELYAVWQINTYTVTYDANGGEGAPEAQSKVYGDYLTISIATPTREGHTFLGWSTDANATEATYVAEDSFVVKTNATLYAVWQINTYDVTYNANGGKNAPAGQVKTYGVDLTLSKVAPTREGHTFLGWATKANATTATYAAGAKYTTNADVTLYAVWQAYTFTISYDANGGKGAPASVTKTYGYAVSINGIEPTRSGYAFLGWAKEADATSAEYRPNDIFTDNADTVLYAVWEKDVVLGANSYNSTIITEAGQSKYFTFTPKESGTYVIYSIVDADTHVYMYNTSGVLLEDDDESGDERNFRLAYKMTAGKTYRFKVKYNDANTGVINFVFGKVYTVSYDVNGGSSVVYAQSKDYGKDIALRTTEPTRSGYTFLGWATTASAKTPKYFAGDSFTTNADTTLYAVWGKNGLEKRADGKWYYVEGGKVVTSKNGLVKHSNGIWYYVKNGVVDKSYTGLCKYNGKWYYVEDGAVDKSYTGLCKYSGKWYYVNKGVVDKSYTGLCKYNSKWYYVNKGVVDKSYTGLCKYNSKWYYVNKGVVDKSYTGNVKYNGKTYKVVKGVKV
ncbi:MAG: InlB B-repeat-containing protein [Clostridia bacterium]|nr:InlB B-repeat-containing protein [Clostridia bacterium]